MTSDSVTLKNDVLYEHSFTTNKSLAQAQSPQARQQRQLLHHHLSLQAICLWLPAQPNI